MAAVHAYEEAESLFAFLDIPPPTFIGNLPRVPGIHHLFQAEKLGYDMNIKLSKK